MTATELHDTLAAHSQSADSQALATRIRRGHCCARCGRYGRADFFFYSRWTGNRFCRDIKACDKRARRRSTRGPMAVAQ
jgi:hypothetical protein